MHSFSFRTKKLRKFGYTYHKWTLTGDNVTMYIIEIFPVASGSPRGRLLAAGGMVGGVSRVRGRGGPARAQVVQQGAQLMYVHARHAGVAARLEPRQELVAVL